MAELWDIYDKDRRASGRTVAREEYAARGEKLDPGDYHLVVVIVVVNSKGEIFCTRRSPNKPAPGMWENSGGSVLAGEDSLSAAHRELLEETGIDVPPEELELFFRQTRRFSHFDIYITRQDFPLGDVVLQKGETDAARWFPYDEWERLGRAGEILTPAGRACDEFFEKLRNYIEGGE